MQLGLRFIPTRSDVAQWEYLVADEQKLTDLGTIVVTKYYGQFSTTSNLMIRCTPVLTHALWARAGTA